MIPRARLLTTLRHQEPDRVPIDFGGMSTGIEVEAYNRLKVLIGFKGETKTFVRDHVEIDEPLARVEDGLIEIGLFNVDVEAVEAHSAVRADFLGQRPDGQVLAALADDQIDGPHVQVFVKVRPERAGNAMIGPQDLFEAV